MPPAGRVLVVQPAFLGDVVFSSALVDALADRFAEVDVCVIPRARDVALAMPRAARVHVFDKRGADKGPSGLWRTARRLRERRYDAAALPHRSPRSALLAALAGIPRRVGFRGAPGSLLYTERVAAPAGGFVQREAALARAFGVEPRPMRLVARPEWVGAAEERLRAADGQLRGVSVAFAALCIGSEWETKIWPAQQFALLADRLAERGLTPVLLGGPREKPLAEAVQARAGAQCLDTTGNEVGEALAILARSAICVGGDSGLTHAARALGIPTVALFGPTDPAAHQMGARQRAVALGIECSPCSAHGQRRCPLGHHRCMRDLGAEVVLQHCEAVLA
jgi:lipopolysaccharide heptosyltransferase II